MPLLDGEAFREYLTDFRVSAWRWECQPSYNIPREQPVLAAYAAGEPKPSGMNAGWHERVRRIVESGRTIGRVRGIWRPLTDYQRRQLEWVYPDSAMAGERIQALDLTDDDYGLPSWDFWIVDDKHVIHMNFADDGSLISRELLADPDLSQYLEWKRTAVDRAVSLSDVRT